ncbi:hypothetical protein DR999_PMT21273 [Platysternon megacephalum]|uniref:Uncharacterized protein n=1 Tax=Platysternon megacephalum TaxID=55544 RepID=A0A4D9DPK9_9SAUR|nr:hypothetical protein DR999_PMT21273 [Platysternon megacephalum]
MSKRGASPYRRGGDERLTHSLQQGQPPPPPLLVKFSPCCVGFHQTSNSQCCPCNLSCQCCPAPAPCAGADPGLKWLQQDVLTAHQDLTGNMLAAAWTQGQARQSSNTQGQLKAELCSLRGRGCQQSPGWPGSTWERLLEGQGPHQSPSEGRSPRINLAITLDACAQASYCSGFERSLDSGPTGEIHLSPSSVPGIDTAEARKHFRIVPSNVSGSQC